MACLLAEYGTMYVAEATPAMEHMDTMWPPFTSMSGRNSKMVQNCGNIKFNRKTVTANGRPYLRVGVDLKNLSDRLPG